MVVEKKIEIYMNIELSNKTILVTGGAGFIGSNLCEALLEKGNKVVCLDNFATGKRENLEQLLKDSNFTLIEGDIRKLEDCLKATKDVDYVLHQARAPKITKNNDCRLPKSRKSHCGNNSKMQNYAKMNPTKGHGGGIARSALDNIT